MFQRKKRSASVPRPNAAPSAPAQSAATQAFLSNKPSTGSLSASAAAAALRAVSPTPIPVSAVQTRRTVQRQSSTGSHARDDKGVHRRSSLGSMTDRTFRTPSPNRSTHDYVLEDVPPVPPIPKSYDDDPSHRRAASIEPATRVVSPPPRAKGVRLSSLDRSSIATQQPHVQHRSKRSNGGKLERSDSQSSANSSYPNPARPNSTQPSSSVPRSRTRSLTSQSPHSMGDVPCSLNQTSPGATRKQKPEASKASIQGNNLPNGGTENKPSGGALETSGVSAESKQSSSTRVNPKSLPVAASYSSRTGSDAPIPVVDEDLASEEGLTKRTQRASGTLTKQPSVVKEDWAGEQVDFSSSGNGNYSHAQFAVGPAQHKSNGHSKKDTAIPTSSKRATEASHQGTKDKRQLPHLNAHLAINSSRTRGEVPTGSTLNIEKDATCYPRQPSLSPSRSTRFSAQLASEFSGRPRHQPPGRSVSPAKSALKHHSPSQQPSSLADGGISTRWKRASQASSEASDNTSMASADGLGANSQVRKTMRVSFDTSPEIVSMVAEEDSSDGVPTFSAQGKDPPKEGRAFTSSSSNLDSIPAEDDMKEVLKPRPVLPSFGSIRGRKADSTEQSSGLPEVASPSSSEASSTSNLVTMGPSTSYDEFDGDFLSSGPRTQRIGSKISSSILDSSGESGVQGRTASKSTPERTDDVLYTPTEIRNRPETASLVPSIAIQPATPGLEELKLHDQWLVEVPGSFPVVSERRRLSSSTLPGDANSVYEQRIGATVHSKAHVVEPEPSQVTSTESSSADKGRHILDTFHQAESDSDGESASSSIYSDAAEDPDDLEGDGFGSINAIVESPVSAAPTQSFAPPSSSLVAGDAESHGTVRQVQPESYATTEVPWRGLDEKQRDYGQKQEEGNSSLPAKPRKKKKRTENGKATIPKAKIDDLASDLSGKGAREPAPSLVLTSSKPSPFGQRTMRSSTRDQSEQTKQGHGFKSSMRSDRSSASHAYDSPASIPAKEASRRKAPISSLDQARVRQSSAKFDPTRSKGMTKPFSRELSLDSDSSGSFRRARRPASSGGITMRTSMRSAGAQPKSLQRPQTRNIRSLSPATRRPFSPKGDEKLRTTMRGSVSGPAPSLRSQNGRKSPSNLSALMKSRSKAGAQTQKPGAGKFKSRFLDSDDEEQSSPRNLYSRFDDSTDEERGVSSLRPVRGIPRNPIDDDSTDLEDSSDDGQRRGTKQRQRSLRSPGNDSINMPEKQAKNLGAAQSTSSSVDTKKKGLFGRFRDKKAKDVGRPTSPLAVDQQTGHVAPRMHLGPSSPQSASFPDTKGKLQRRHIPQRATSDSWSLSPRLPLGADSPTTSNGITDNSGLNGNPGLGGREDTASVLETEGKISRAGHVGKKKRFPMLRKAFGL